jgi:hypothetical protein
MVRRADPKVRRGSGDHLGSEFERFLRHSAPITTSISCDPTRSLSVLALRLATPGRVLFGGSVLFVPAGVHPLRIPSRVDTTDRTSVRRRRH